MTDPTKLNSAQSPDAVAQRLLELTAPIARIAPEFISDNRIDLTPLKNLLGDESCTPFEHYEVNCAGKAAARREIQKKRWLNLFKQQFPVYKFAV